MFDDLDDFKQIDDTLGHAAGAATLIGRADEAMYGPGQDA
jgi:GGDEF domain-containing protein